MTQFKFSVFVIVFLVALFGAGHILYNKQNSTISKKTVPTTYHPETQEVKGSEIQAKKDQVLPSSDLTKQYTKNNANSHLALTRENIIWYTNYERTKNKIAPLNSTDALNRSSTNKNDDMFHYQYFEHVRKGDAPVGFDSFIDKQNYKFIKIGENLAMGDFSTSAEVVAAWMKSPAHKKNILDPAYRDIGATVSRGAMNGKTVYLVSQHFGVPRDSCPAISQSTKNQITAIKLAIVSLQGTINSAQKKISQSSSTFDPHFDTLIAEYNSLVSTYNESINDMGSLVDEYNAQVRRFDLCLQGKN